MQGATTLTLITLIILITTYNRLLQVDVVIARVLGYFGGLLLRYCLYLFFFAVLK